MSGGLIEIIILQRSIGCSISYWPMFFPIQILLQYGMSAQGSKHLKEQGAKLY